VVYQNLSKENWLKIPAELLKKYGDVSAEVTETLAESLLERTPDCDITCAVTGHLGPNAPKSLDGMVFVAVASRIESSIQIFSFQLKSKKRADRQLEASLLVLSELFSVLRT